MFLASSTHGLGGRGEVRGQRGCQRGCQRGGERGGVRRTAAECLTLSELEELLLHSSHAGLHVSGGRAGARTLRGGRGRAAVPLVVHVNRTGVAWGRRRGPVRGRTPLRHAAGRRLRRRVLTPEPAGRRPALGGRLVRRRLRGMPRVSAGRPRPPAPHTHDPHQRAVRRRERHRAQVGHVQRGPWCPRRRPRWPSGPRWPRER